MDRWDYTAGLVIGASVMALTNGSWWTVLGLASGSVIYVLFLQPRLNKKLNS